MESSESEIFYFFLPTSFDVVSGVMSKIWNPKIKSLPSNSKPYFAIIFMQITYAVMSILAKQAFTQGMSPHVLVAYRMMFGAILIAPLAFFLERCTRPKMTFITFVKICLLSFFEPVISQNLYYTGMKFTTATFTSAMCNILPAITFVMACIFRREKVKLRSGHSQAKIVGTTVTIGGAMCMTLIKGPSFRLPLTARIFHDAAGGIHGQQHHHMAEGALMIVAGCFAWSCFIILQASLLEAYPAELTLAGLVCFTSAVEGTALAFILEHGDTSLWKLHFDVKLLTVVYGGLVSASAYFIMGWLMKKRGPVFVSSFNPLGLVFTAIFGSIFLSEELFLGSIIGAVVVITGLYLILWGRRRSNEQISSNQVADGEFDQEMATINGVHVIKISFTDRD